MQRRTFLGVAGIAAMYPGRSVVLEGAQELLHPISYPQFAVQLADTYGSVSARTELRSEARDTSGLLYDSAAAILNQDSDAAREAVDRFEARAGAGLPALTEIAERRGIIEFGGVIRGGVEQCRADISRIDETGDIVVDRLSRDVVLCLLRAPAAFENCLGPLWTRALKCSLASLPMARLGVYAYAGSVGACMFDDLIDVAVDVIAECFPEFRDQVGECLG